MSSVVSELSLYSQFHFNRYSKLILPLQFDVNSDRAAAQWVSDKHVLRLILPIERSLPAVIA
jgi:hypothetical protein